LKALTTDPHPQVDLYVNESDISFLKIILEVIYIGIVTVLNYMPTLYSLSQAPEDEANCPYRNGTFLLTCDIPQSYPRDPPEVRFVTFILHPNVSGMVAMKPSHLY
jgi:ubiquitin-protein ligase